MCVGPFRSRPPTVMSTPAPIQPRQPDLIQTSRLPTKKELLDPDDVAGVEYGTQTKKDAKGASKRTVTDALKININTGSGTGGGAGTGGINV